MRRILIDEHVERVADAYLKDLLNPKKTRWREMPKKRLGMIYRSLGTGQEHLKCYVSLLLCLYEKIVVLKSEEFDGFHKRYFSRWDDNLDEVVTPKQKKMTMTEAVQWALRYNDLRESFIPEHLMPLGIQACVYCNEQSACSVTENDQGGRRNVEARYQIDHYYPQSKYPYLCTSFYNLQPSCDKCNRKKWNQWSQFNLYTSDANKQDVFRFAIGDADQILDALISHQAHLLDIQLHANEDGLLENHEHLFGVERLYQQNHKRDAWRVMDILYKQSDSYIRSLKDALGVYVTMTDDEVIDEYFMLFGYDMHKNQVHRRPLNKLAQDIVEFYQLP